MNIRKKASAALVLSWILIIVAQSYESIAKNVGQRGTIVALGDSLTAGHGVAPEDAYPARLEKKLHAAGYDWRVINAGISGETSSGTLMRVNAILKLRPDIVILETGVNDEQHGIDLRTTFRNIEEIVRIFQTNQSTVLLAGMRTLNGHQPNPAFAEIYPDIARKYGLILIPFFLKPVAGNPALNLYDGIHPTAEGYRGITKMLYPYVQKAIEDKTREVGDYLRKNTVSDNVKTGLTRSHEDTKK